MSRILSLFYRPHHPTSALPSAREGDEAPTHPRTPPEKQTRGTSRGRGRGTFLDNFFSSGFKGIGMFFHWHLEMNQGIFASGSFCSTSAALELVSQ